MDGSESASLFGGSVSRAGDVNGDGYDDVIVGARDEDDPEINEGKAYLFLGSATGLHTSPDWTGQSDQEFAAYGASVSSAGDVNGDGFDDVIVGAYYFANPEENEGAVWLYLGSAAGLGTDAAWQAESDIQGGCLGYSVSSAGDVNGDGYDDVLIGLACIDDVYLYLGSALGLESTPAWTVSSDQFLAWLGWSVSSAGDVNGDGFDDVVLGAWGYDTILSAEGVAYVYLGSAAGLAPTPDWTAEGDQASAYFGWSVASAGDVNGDGFDDVVIGERQYDDLYLDEGRANLYLGSADGLEESASWTAGSLQASAYFGYSVASAGDVNSDGFDDVVVSAHTYDDVETDEGLIAVYLGSSTGLGGTAAWTATSGQASARLGSVVAPAGDVNGDGLDDVLASAVRFDVIGVDEGRVFLYSPACPVTTPDTDNDGLADQCDACVGDNASGDGDLDGVCASGSDGSVEDCDDANPEVQPGAIELCNNIDDDCDGLLPAEESDADVDGVSACGGDCDDADPAAFPGAAEQCNGHDDTCAGAVPAAELDPDADGSLSCAGDCDDVDDRVAPTLAEICDDALDNNCDGAVDEECESAEPQAGCGCTGVGSVTPWPLASLLLIRRRRRHT